MVTVAQRACNYYLRVADRKQIRILFEPAAEVPFVRTDRVAVAAVLDNLLSNAVKYSPPGKRVWVRVLPEADHVVVSVQDEGPGLSEEDRAKLFQRGVRLSAVPTGGRALGRVRAGGGEGPGGPAGRRDLVRQPARPGGLLLTQQTR